MRLLAKLLISALLVAVSVFGFTATAASADNQRSCYGQLCDGLDPSQTTCAGDASTLMSRHAVTGTGEDIGLLELRYSPSCHSNWVRFTPWFGVRSWFANGMAEAPAYGRPWIWREGVPNSLRGYANQSSVADLRVQTVWSQMVTADGTTCSSVGLYQLNMKGSGQINYDPLGSYNAPCIS